jgi:chitinase
MAQQPDDIIVIQRIQKVLKDSYQNVGDVMISGGVDNMDKYKYLLGQAHAYQYIIQEISNLLDNKEHNNYDDGNVINLGKGSTKD